ncbi:MAG TPA: hypothetical protein QGF58_14660 [Myxococcota bacterium]|nr:hypothetical protein [Myxococcota bacterium]
MRLRLLLGASVLLVLGCSGEMWKSCTSTVVGTTVETTKEVGSGIKEGVEEGRKSGESLDGARLITTLAELKLVGGVEVYALEPADGGSKIVLALQNTTDVPLRIANTEFEVLDDEGFTVDAIGFPKELTVPANAKDKASATVPIPPERIATVRLWGEDLELPEAPEETPPE